MTMDMSPKTLKFERIFPAMSRSMHPSPSSKSSRTSLWSRPDPCSSQASRRSGLALALTDPGQVGRCVQQAWALAGRNKLGATWICGFSWPVKHPQRLTPDWPSRFSGWVESKLRILVMQLEIVNGMRIHPNPMQHSTQRTRGVVDASIGNHLARSWGDPQQSIVMWYVGKLGESGQIPSVNCYITMEHHHFSWENQRFWLGHFQ